MRCLSLFAAALGLASPALAEPSGPLRYGWKTGEVVRYRITARITGSMPLFQSPEPIDLDATLRTVFHARVVSVGPEGATLAVGVESAEAEVANIPLEVPTEDVQKYLSQTVRLAPTGEVISVTGGEPLPFDLAIPGVDPKRLYALMFPVVFPEHAPAPGEEWPFVSELLGGRGSGASFHAILRPPGAARPATAARPSGAARPATAARPSGAARPASATTLAVATRFTMPVDQVVPEKDPGPGGIPSPAKSRKGTIEGDGAFRFAPRGARLHHGQVNLRADIVERLLGPPHAPEAPVETRTRIAARITVQIEPTGPAPAVRPASQPARAVRPASQPARANQPAASSARRGR
ncbi:MAG TPA: hypothetical protein VLH79_00470 [Chthonomonadales bacterium]|nr:hypothetical protein [Chthonomonadales bacterium]